MKKVDPIERAKRASEAIALARQNDLADKFTAEELIYSLRERSCPYSQQLVWGLKSLKMLEKNGKYLSFSSKDPVHYAQLVFLLSGYSSAHVRYAKKHNDKKKEIKNTLFPKKETTVALVNFSETEAIVLLKSMGYKVMKPVTNYEEI